MYLRDRPGYLGWVIFGVPVVKLIITITNHFYILLAESELGLKDPAIENFNESGSAELYLTVTPILVILFMTTPSFALL